MGVSYTQIVRQGSHWETLQVNQEEIVAYLVSERVIRTKYDKKIKQAVLAATLDIGVAIRRQNSFQDFILKNYTNKRVVCCM